MVMIVGTVAGFKGDFGAVHSNSCSRGEDFQNWSLDVSSLAKNDKVLAARCKV